MNIKFKLNWEEFQKREKFLGLEGETLYTLKHNTNWEERDGDKVLCDFDWSLFHLVTGLDKHEGCFNEVHYCKEEDGLYKLYFLYFVEGDVIYNAFFEFSGDVLYSERRNMTLENYLNDKINSIYWEVVTDYLQKQLDKNKETIRSLGGSV